MFIDREVGLLVDRRAHKVQAHPAMARVHNHRRVATNRRHAAFIHAPRDLGGVTGVYPGPLDRLRKGKASVCWLVPQCERNAEAPAARYYIPFVSDVLAVCECRFLDARLRFVDQKIYGWAVDCALPVHEDAIRTAAQESVWDQLVGTRSVQMYE